MARMVYDLIEPQVLVDYVRTYDNEVLRPDNQFALGQYLPPRNTEDLEFKIRQGALNDVDIAEYRAFDTPARMTDRPGTKMIAGSLGPVSRQIPLGEEEMLRTRALERSTNDPIIQAILDDAERMVRSVQARIELARGDVIDDGIVNINENGLSLTANFGRPTSLSKTASVAWTDPTAPIITDLLAWQEAREDAAQDDTDHILMPKKMRGLMMLNEQARQFYAGANGVVRERINPEALSAVLDAEGIPPIRTYDVSVRIDGVKTRVLPENKLYLMPSGSVGDTWYGTTAEAIKLRSKGYIKREATPGIVAVVTEEDHPVQTYTVGTALAVPALGRADQILDAEVF